MCERKYKLLALNTKNYLIWLQVSFPSPLFLVSHSLFHSGIHAFFPQILSNSYVLGPILAVWCWGKQTRLPFGTYSINENRQQTNENCPRNYEEKEQSASLSITRRHVNREPIAVKWSEKASLMSCCLIRDLKNKRGLARQRVCGKWTWLLW